MRRREFIAGLRSASVWPVVALAQQVSGRRPLVVVSYSHPGGNVTGVLLTLEGAFPAA
jgi:hypothetical protein